MVAFVLEDHGGEAFDAFGRVAQGFERGVVDVDVLITFSDPDGDEPEIDTVELVPACRYIDFGSVWPDYGDEDPNSEYY